MSAEPVRFGVVGHGWRADFFLRLAQALPDRFACTGLVTRTADTGRRLEQQWGVRTFRQVEDLVVATAPEVVVTSVPPPANAEVVRAAVACEVAVLSETPPAPDLDGLRALWHAVGASGRVQVAEQHPFLPAVVALRGLVERGVLGEVTSAQVSWTHDYHAMAMLRCLLDVGSEPVRVRAVRSPGPLVEGSGRDGRPSAPSVRRADQTLALLEVAGRTGVYDFTEGQWFHPLRRRHVVLRGSSGEVVGTDVRWAGPDGITLSAPVVRRQTGVDGDLEGFALDALTWGGSVLYRNPFPGVRLSDEEIAIGSCLAATGAWWRGAAAGPYPLADACQDQLVALAVHRAAVSGGVELTGAEPWSAAVRGAAPVPA